MGGWNGLDKKGAKPTKMNKPPLPNANVWRPVERSQRRGKDRKNMEWSVLDLEWTKLVENWSIRSKI